MHSEWFLEYTNDLPISIDAVPLDYFYSETYDYLTLPEAKLLITLANGHPVYTFSGLKTKTNLHQQRLTKALKRLQERGLVIKNSKGTYQLSDKGVMYSHHLVQNLIKEFNSPINKTKIKDYSLRYNIVIDAHLEFDGSYESIVDTLERKWFGAFRYLFKRNHDSWIELVWINNLFNNQQLYLHINLITGQTKIKLESSSHISSNSVSTILHWLESELSSIHASLIITDHRNHSIEKAS
ncbi:MAG: hypothetical protein ACTSYD_06445 [Candidatus Heimdallarchaeaceae archaeon]